eukprot:1770028-Alexandrium_andersonii.AAC.1
MCNASNDKCKRRAQTHRSPRISLGQTAVVLHRTRKIESSIAEMAPLAPPQLVEEAQDAPVNLSLIHI